LLQRMSPEVALNGHAGSHQICPLLKVDRTCHRATVTAHTSGERAWRYHNALSLKDS